MRVLVIEHDPDVLELVSELLRLDGFHVVGVSDPRRALEIMDSLHPDVILLDVAEPGAAAEFRRAQRRSARHADVPIVVVSEAPDADPATLQAARVLGRPFSIREVEAALRELQDERRAAPR